MTKIIQDENHETIMLTKIKIIFLKKYPAKNRGTVHFPHINQILLYEIL